ncbi:MAG: hypothetical protein ACE5LU_24215, partial [Anaerolineae bacterium]
KRFDKIDDRFDKIDDRFDKIDDRFDKIDDRFEAMDDRINETYRMVRNWMLAGFAFLAALFTVIQLYLSP